MPGRSQRSVHVCIEQIEKQNELASAISAIQQARLNPQLSGFENRWLRVEFASGAETLYLVRTQEPLPRHRAFNGRHWQFVDAGIQVRSISCS